LLEEKIIELESKETGNIDNILQNEIKQLKKEVNRLEEELRNKKDENRGSILSARSLKKNEIIHPKNQPLKRMSVLESLVNLKESQVLNLKEKLDDMIKNYEKTKVRLKRQTSIEKKELKKKEDQISKYKKSLESLETNLESLSEMNKNLNKNLEEKEELLKQNNLKEKVTDIVKTIFDILELFLNFDYIICLFFIFIAFTAYDSFF
jgi:hypothetical protein